MKTSTQFLCAVIFNVLLLGCAEHSGDKEGKASTPGQSERAGDGLTPVTPLGLSPMTHLDVQSTEVMTPGLQLEEVFIEAPGAVEDRDTPNPPDEVEDVDSRAYFGVGAGGESEPRELQILLRVETGYIQDTDFSKEDDEAKARLILLRTRTDIAINPRSSGERVPYYEFEGELVSWSTVFQTAGLDFGARAIDIDASRIVELGRERAVRVSLMGLTAGFRRQIAGSPRLQFLIQAAVDLVGIRTARYYESVSSRVTRAFDVTQVELETGLEWIPNGKFRMKLTVGGDVDFAFNSRGIFSEQTFFAELRAQFLDKVDLFFRTRWWRARDRIQNLESFDAVQLLFGITYYFGSR